VSAEVGRHPVQCVSERVDGVDDELDLRLLHVDLRRQRLVARTRTAPRARLRPRLYDVTSRFFTRDATA